MRFILVLPVALCAMSAPSFAADAPGVCSFPTYITAIGGEDRPTMLREIDQKCHPGDKITLPKSESYLVTAACDLGKPTVDLGPRVLCLLRDPNPTPVVVARGRK